MKGLEKILKNVKIATASLLAATVLPTYAQNAYKISPSSSENWSDSSPATLYFEKSLSSAVKVNKNDPRNQFKTTVYFSGRRTGNNNLEILYTTTDTSNLQPNPANEDMNKTKIYFLSDSEDVTAEIVSQHVIVIDRDKEIKFRPTTPREKANNLVLKFGENLTEFLGKKTSEYSTALTAGLLNFNINEAMRDYITNKEKQIADRGRNIVGNDLCINNIPLQTRTSFSMSDKQVGRTTELRFYSPDGKPRTISLYFNLGLKREDEKEFGTLEAYTGPIIINTEIDPSKQVCQTGPSHPLEGLWKFVEDDGMVPGMYINSSGIMMPIEGSDDCITTMILNPDNSIRVIKVHPNGEIEKIDAQGKISEIGNGRAMLSMKSSIDDLDIGRPVKMERLYGTQEIISASPNIAQEQPVETQSSREERNPIQLPPSVERAGKTLEGIAEKFDALRRAFGR